MSTARKLKIVSNGLKPMAARMQLRGKPRTKLVAHSLPFVGTDHVQPNIGGVSHWDVPLTGSFQGGTETGAAIALMFLSHLRDEHMRGREDHVGLNLILGSMLDRVPCSVEETSTLRGQAVGFASVLERWLIAAVKHLGSSLDDVDLDKLLASANAGLDASGANQRFAEFCEKEGI